MQRIRKAIILGVCAVLVPSVAASSAIGRIASDTVPGGWNPGTGVSGTGRASGVLECVPYARQLSGIHIYGDAHTWWSQAKGRYARGHMPRVGAVMAVEPHNNSRLGHVATVSRIVDSRTILLSHANWSYRGQIERNVTALDVSPGNDWSEVRIWYGPNRNLGTTHWPVAGFIYNARPGTLRDLGPDLGGNRLAQISAPTKAGTKRQQRRRDPIGEIIAGTY